MTLRPRPTQGAPSGSPPPSRPKPDKTLLAPVGLVLVAILFAPQLIAVMGRPVEDTQGHEAVGYNRVVRLFAARGWLISHRNGNDPDEPVVTVSRRIQNDVGDYSRHSFLRHDIEANDATLWQFGPRGVRGIDPSAHRVIGPFAQVNVWRGAVNFRNPPRSDVIIASAAGDRFRLLPNPTGWSRTDRAPPAKEIAAFAALTSPVGLSNEAAQGDQHAPIDAQSIVFRGADGAPVASLLLVGNQTLVRVPDGGSVKVFVADTQVRPAGDAVAFAPLLPRQVLKLVSNDGRIAQFELATEDARMSIYESQDHRQRPEFAEPLAKTLEAAMTRLMQEDPDPARWAVAPLNTSLDGPLQKEAQTLLSERSRKLRDDLKAPHSFRSAALVMDAKTGEILAAASFPATLDDLAPNERQSDSALKLLDRNHNVTRMAIGSVAKIPFSSAILDTQPGLGALIIPGSGGANFNEILGQTLESELVEDATQSPVDLTTFIKWSSNKFASTLMLMASAPDPFRPGPFPSSPGYFLGKTPILQLPDGAFHTASLGNGYRLVTDGRSPVVQLTWVPHMATLFDLPNMVSVGSRDDDPDSTADFDLSPWRGVLGPRHDRATRGFLDIAPQREAFGMAIINNLRNDYLQLIMGGNRSTWTTVKVAEVFSRVVTKHVVNASFVANADTQAPAKMPYSADGLAQKEREHILCAMQRVGSGGTGRLLAPSLAKLEHRAPSGETIRVFAKSGTPTLEHDLASPSNRAVNEMINLRIVRIDSLREVRVLGAEKSDVVAITAALSKNGDAREVLRRYRLSAGEVAGYVQGLSGARRTLLAEDGEGGYFVKPDLKPDSGDGGVFAFTMARYRGDESEPFRALTVVVNMQAKVNGVKRNPATELVQQWLAKPRLFQLLMETPTPASTPTPVPLGGHALDDCST